MKASGKVIKKYREEKGLSIKEVSERTKIRPYIIEALESGNFQIMSPIYVKSFLKTLSAFLDFPLSEIDFSNGSAETEQATETVTKSDTTSTQTKKETSPRKSQIEIQKERYKKKIDTKPKNTISFDDENPEISASKQASETDYAAMFKKANKPQISTTQIINYSAGGAVVVAIIL